MSGVDELRAARESGGEERKVGGAIPLIEIGAKLELFHDSGGNAYAARPLPSGGMRTMSLTGGAYRSWLAGEYHRHSGGQKAASAEALTTAISVLTAKALEKTCLEVSIRVAEHGGTIYLDLADDAGRAVEISAAGWRVTQTAPVRFRCERGMLPLPIPEPGGNLEKLRRLINAPGDEEWRLLVGWLIGALRPNRPFTVLVLQGEQGSIKSTTAQFLRGLVDPARPPARSRPRSDQDLAIAARNSWVLSYDNVSTLPEWLSDGLCQIATGGGFATRKLYADDDEAIFDFCRPVMLNGIDELLTRPDLADRALRVALPTIPDERRRPMATVLAEYEAARPRILGALCDAVSGALRGLPAAVARLTSLPRMADFAQWASAAEEGLGWTQGALLAAYNQNRGELVSESLEDDPIASAVLQLVEPGKYWIGPASELLEKLAGIAGVGEHPPKNWPAGPRALSSRLRRIAPLLRRIGIEWKPPPKNQRDGPNRERRHALVRNQPVGQVTPVILSPKPADSGQSTAENATHTRPVPTGPDRSINGAGGQQVATTSQSSSDATGPTGVTGRLHTLDCATRDAPSETQGQRGGGRGDQHLPGNGAGNGWSIQVARRMAAADLAEAARLRLDGREVEARAFEKSAAELKELADSLASTPGGGAQ